MIDLEKTSGLPIQLDGEILKASEGFDLPMPKFRKLKEMKEVLMKGTELTGPEILYTMFRKVAEKGHEKIFEKANLEYDITVLLAGKVGQEFIKTVGHYHSKKEGTEVSYPEVYDVIHGKAHYVFQKVDGDTILDIKTIEASEGDKVIIPPGYGHITINPGSETLVEANIQSTKIRPNYWDVKEERGEGFYELATGEWKKNENYPNIDKFEPKLVKAKNVRNVFDLGKEPMYADFVNNPAKYDFLVSPEKYRDMFDRIY